MTQQTESILCKLWGFFSMIWMFMDGKKTKVGAFLTAVGIYLLGCKEVYEYAEGAAFLSVCYWLIYTGGALSGTGLGFKAYKKQNGQH